MDNRNESETFISTSPVENTTWRQNTTSPDEKLELGVPVALMSSLTFICVITAWVLNIIVLRALGRVPENRLKVRYLLRNAIAGDMMLSLSLGIRVIFQLADAREGNTQLAALCANMIYDFYAFFTTFYQIFASMAVGIDRFASILKPLAYHTMKYTRLAKTAVIGTVFALAFGLSFPVIVLRLEPGDPIIEICYKAFDQLRYSGEALPAILIISVVVTLILYCVIFVMIICHRRKTRNTLGERSEAQKATKSEMSLALTFFFIHITYVLMYLPGALYHSILSWRLESQPYLHYYIGQLTIVIYLGNAIVDPLIYIFRIRSIRDEVPKLCCLGSLKTKGVNKGVLIGASADSKSLPSISNLTSVSTVDPN